MSVLDTVTWWLVQWISLGFKMTSDTVRILTLDGKISSELYCIEVDKADRKGHISLIEVGTNRKLKVNQRRILRNCNEDEAYVVETGDKYRAACPKCSYHQDVKPTDSSMNCPDHAITKLQWRERPMSNVVTESQNPESQTAETQKPMKQNKPTSEKKEKPVREQIPVDFDKITEIPGLQLYTKKSVSFDHAKISVAAHVLICTNQPMRKLCFNTYDGTLGKKGKPLQLDAFVANQDTEGKKPWYMVEDLDKTIAKLVRDGYEKHEIAS